MPDELESANDRSNAVSAVLKSCPATAMTKPAVAGQGSRIYLPVLVADALVFLGDPHAAISDGIITGTGVECSMNVRARITLLKDRVLERPIIAQLARHQPCPYFDFCGEERGQAIAVSTGGRST